MQRSVETAKSLLAQGNCYGVDCLVAECPLYTPEQICDGNDDNGCRLNPQSVRKLQEFIKENSSMTKEDQIIEVVTAFKAGETIRRIDKCGGSPVADFCKGGKLVQEWDFNNYRYEVVRVLKHCCDGNRVAFNAESVRKLQEFIKENEKMLDLTKNQIVDPPVECRVKSDHEPWKKAKLVSVDHRGRYAYMVDNDGYRLNYPECSLTDPTEPQYRPLSTEELSGMVGTVLVTRDLGFHILATAFNPLSEEVFLGNEWCKADRLFDLHLHLDGSPVGVLIK